MKEKKSNGWIKSNGQRDYRFDLFLIPQTTKQN
jgi:hypothetical protein